MKKYAVISILIIGLVLMFAGCGQSEQAEEVNVRMELTKQSTLDKIVASGELRHGFEAGYMPVNTAWDGIIPSLMTDKFDIIMRV
jgi:polar amino acid transport system substrate-binding protein